MNRRTGNRRQEAADVCQLFCLILLPLSATLLYAVYLIRYFLRRNIVMIGAFSELCGEQGTGTVVSRGLSSEEAQICYQKGVDALTGAGYEDLYRPILMRTPVQTGLFFLLILAVVFALVLMIGRRRKRRYEKELASVISYLRSDTPA